MNPMIATHQLARKYLMGSNEVQALRGVDITIQAGEFVALMGPSGSGKSTLLHLLGCLDRPTSGEYFLEGTSVHQLNNDQRAQIRNRRIGFIFQSFNLLSRLTAFENVGLPILYSQQEGDWQARALEALRRVGLENRIDHHPNELSGGQQQRVAIARALVCNPAIILADEPTGNLDSVSSKDIMRLLVELCQEGRTLLMVTHDKHSASYASRTLFMRDGQMVSGGDGNVID